MAISLDIRQSGTNSAGATSIGWSHTVGASANFLIVGCTTGAFPVKSVSSVTFGAANLSNTVNGSAATKNDTSGPSCNANLWYLTGPTPSTATITVTPSGSCELTGGSESWIGVDQTSTFNAASPQTAALGAGVNPTLTVTSAVGEQVVDCVVFNESGTVGAITAGSGQTAYYALNNGANTSAGAGSDEAGAASVVTDWSVATTAAIGDSAQVAVSLKPAAAGAAQVPYQRQYLWAPLLAQ